MKKIRLILILCALMGSFSAYSQENLIQFSGIIVTGDSLMPVPYTQVMIKNSNRGTFSDFFGYFSIVVAEGDSVMFSAMGYNKALFIVPDSLTEKRYSYIQILTQKIIELDEVAVTPWPSKEAFHEAFLSLEMPKEALNANENLQPSQLLVMLETADVDGFGNYYSNSEEFHNELFYAGSAPSINLLSPLAWAEFINAWRDGKFKIKR